MGVDLPLKASGIDRYVLRAAPFGQEREKSVKDPTNSVSYFEWGPSMKRLDLSDGGLRSPHAEDEVYPGLQFA